MKKHICLDCQGEWESEEKEEEPVACPKCRSKNIVFLVFILEE